jgi:hypothetical protein
MNSLARTAKRPDRDTARPRLEDERVDRPRVMHGDPDRQRMKQKLRAARGEEIVGGDLVGGIVVGLRHALAAEQDVRRVEAAKPVDAAEKVVGDAMHDLLELTMHIGMQATEIGDARGRAHAAEKAVALDNESREPRARRHSRRGNARRPTAEHDNIVLAEERRLARGLFDCAGTKGPTIFVHRLKIMQAGRSGGRLLVFWFVPTRACGFNL